MKHTLTCFLAAGLMALVGCGGDESGDSGNTTTEDSSASNSSTDTGAAAASADTESGDNSGGSTAVATAPKTPVIGQMHPEITGPDTDGVEFNLSDYRGKVVMVDFWGDW